MAANNYDNGRVLIVDDQHSNRQVMMSMLRGRGYEVALAEGGEEALAIIPQFMPDLVLLDVAMPGMDGYEVCERIKADSALADIPVIFVSAMQEIDNKVRGFQVGGVDYITKPFKVEEVLARVRSQITLSHQRQQIIALSRTKDQLIHTVSHDLKNPINIIMGYVDMLTRPEELTHAEITEFANSVMSTARNMNALVSDLLDISQLETGGIKLKIQTVRAATAIENALIALEMMAGQKNVELSAEVDPPDLAFPADPRRIGQVLANLVSNGIKYTPEGGRVHVSAHRDNGWAVLRVMDNGLGIPADVLPRLFEKFYRIPDAEYYQQEGTGLGLSIVQGIVEQHGGTIAVESEVGQGSVFQVAMPLER